MQLRVKCWNIKGGGCGELCDDKRLIQVRRVPGLDEKTDFFVL